MPRTAPLLIALLVATVTLIALTAPALDALTRIGAGLDGLTAP